MGQGKISTVSLSKFRSDLEFLSCSLQNFLKKEVKQCFGKLIFLLKTFKIGFKFHILHCFTFNYAFLNYVKIFKYLYKFRILRAPIRIKCKSIGKKISKFWKKVVLYHFANQLFLYYYIFMKLFKAELKVMTRTPKKLNLIIFLESIANLDKKYFLYQKLICNLKKLLVFV